MYLNEDTRFEIKFAPGKDTNNKVELIALWSFLRLEMEKRVQNLHIFGDSKMTIELENGNIHINAPHLQQLLRAIIRILVLFSSFNITHIYRELNMEEDSMSKLTLLLALGHMETEEIKED